MCYYILQDKIPVPVDCIVFEHWFKNIDNRHIALTQQGGVKVSTVFLGLDRNAEREGTPILFETLVSGGKHDGECWEYSTFDEAMSGHEYWCSVAFPGFSR